MNAPAERGHPGRSGSSAMAALDHSVASPADAAAAGRMPALRAALLALGAVASFHLGFTFAPLCWLVLAYLGCLFALRRVATARQAFYFGLAVGLGVFVPQMTFLWGIFGPAAAPLWLILAFFHGVFLLMLNRVEVRLGPKWAVWLAPVLWCGIEYFRSEVWWLRFAWFTAGSIVRTLPGDLLLSSFGVYGVGAVAMLLVVLPVAVLRPRRPLLNIGTTALVSFVLFLLLVPMPSNLPKVTKLKVAGIQLEFPGPPEILIALDRVAKAHPEAELLMLSEYTFDGPVPDSVKAWCQRNRKWLVAGGKLPVAETERGLPGRSASAATNGLDNSKAPTADGAAAARMAARRPLSEPSAGDGERYFNTAFVISTNGEVVFTQAKSVPIQFFKDGEPAREQRVWDSPWGRLGIAICYDVSYRRVMDALIRQGAQALLIPTMDVEQWGEPEHRLNARMARLRAAEYGVPIFRVASSGISQIINPGGHEEVAAPFPGPGEIIAGELRLRKRSGSVPLDAWFAPACTVATGGVMVGLGALAWRERRLRKEAA